MLCSEGFADDKDMSPHPLYCVTYQSINKGPFKETANPLRCRALEGRALLAELGRYRGGANPSR